MAVEEHVQIFEAEFDNEGVYFYQAYNDEIADFALENQTFGGPSFNPNRMTWIKPSFAWVLYRSGYGSKPNQTRVLKIKLSHEILANLLNKCACGHGGGGTKGRIQWDPARDILSGEGKVPRKLLRKRAIQIGLGGDLSKLYVDNILTIQDVTELAHKVGIAHSGSKAGSRSGSKAGSGDESGTLPSELLPLEREYLPKCSEEVLANLGMRPGETADKLSKLGLGMASLKK